MNKNQAEQLSALMDGNLDEIQTIRLLDDMTHDVELKALWERYHLISDVMGNHLQPVATSDLMERIHHDLEAEPVPLQPKRGLMTLMRPVVGFALAASVAMVAVLGYRSVMDPIGVSGAVVAQHESAKVNTRLAGMRWNVDKPAVEEKLDGYLVNHSGYTGNGVQGMLPYARIVGYDANGR